MGNMSDNPKFDGEANIVILRIVPPMNKI